MVACKCNPESKVERALGFGALMCIVGALFAAVTPTLWRLAWVACIITWKPNRRGFDHGSGCFASAGRGAVLPVVIVCSLASLPIAILTFIAALPIGAEPAPPTVIIAGACSLPGIAAVLGSSICLRCGCAKDAGAQRTHAVTTNDIEVS